MLQRCTNRVSTDKLLAEIIRKLVPKTKIVLKDRKDNKITTLSTQVTPQSLKTIDKIISSQVIQKVFKSLEEQGTISNQKTSNVKSIIIRVALCYFLSNLNDLQKNPLLYQRALTLKSSERILQKIYQEKYGGSKN